MTNAILRSYQVFGADDVVLAAAADALKQAVKDAKAHGKVQRVVLARKGYRQDIEVGDVYVVPASVCDDPKDFPGIILSASLRKVTTGEGAVEFKMGALVDPSEVSKDSLKSFKNLVFKNRAGDSTPLIVFAPAWAHPHDFISFPHEDGEELTQLRDVAYAAPFDPSLSSCFDQLRAVDPDQAPTARIMPEGQHIFKTVASDEPDYPKFVSGLDVAAGEGGKKASMGKRPVIRLFATEFQDVKNEAPPPDEINLFQDLGAEVKAVATTLPGKFSALRLADGDLGAIAESNPGLAADQPPPPPPPAEKQEQGGGGAPQMPGGLGGEAGGEAAGAAEGAGAAGGAAAELAPLAVLAYMNLAEAEYKDPAYGEEEPLLADGQLKKAEKQPAAYVDPEFAGQRNVKDSELPKDGDPGSLGTITPAEVDGKNPHTAAHYQDTNFGKGEGLRRQPDYGAPGSKETVSPADVDGPSARTAKAEEGPWVIINEKTGEVVKECANHAAAAKVYKAMNAEKGGYEMKAKSYHEETKPKKAADEGKGVVEVGLSEDTPEATTERVQDTSGALTDITTQPVRVVKSANMADETIKAVNLVLQDYAKRTLPGEAIMNIFRGLLDSSKEIKNALMYMKGEGFLKSVGNSYYEILTPTQLDDAKNQSSALKGKDQDDTYPSRSHGYIDRHDAAWTIKSAKTKEVWAAEDLDGLKLGGYWSKNASEAAKFSTEAAAKDEIRRNRLHVDAAEVCHECGKGCTCEKAKTAMKLAGNWWNPGTVLEQFYPELQHDVAQSPYIEQTATPDINNSGLSGAAEGKGAPTDPNASGLAQGLESNSSTPLRQEMSFYGPDYSRNFYAPHSNVDDAAIANGFKQSKAASAKPKKADGALSLFRGLQVADEEQDVPEHPQAHTDETIGDPVSGEYIEPQKEDAVVQDDTYRNVDHLLKGVVGGYAAQLIGAFKATSKPLHFDAPFQDKLNLEDVVRQGGDAPTPDAQDAAVAMLKAAMDSLNDDQRKMLLDSATAQAAVWCSDTEGSGGYNYEVFVRAEALEGTQLQITVVTGRK